MSKVQRQAATQEPAKQAEGLRLKDRLSSLMNKRPVAPPEVHRDARSHPRAVKAVSASAEAGDSSAVYVPPSRRGKRQMQVHIDAETLQHLKLLALELGVSQQALVCEGLDLLFEKYRKGPVASGSTLGK